MYVIIKLTKMDKHIKKNFQRYKKHLNSFAGNVSKMKPMEIKQKIREIEMMKIPSYEKSLVKGSIYKKIPRSKRMLLSSSFGNVSPGSNAALTTQATQVAQQTMAAQTLAATQAAATQAAATQASVPQPGASVVPGAVPSQPGFQPAVSQAAVTQAAPAQVRITPSGAIPTTNYQTAAGAINQAKTALLDAGNQLQLIAGAQNLSGFGGRSRFGRRF